MQFLPQRLNGRESLRTTLERRVRRDLQKRVSGGGLTTVISSYKQPICLKRMVQHLRTCHSVVEAIHVNWFESDDPPPNELWSSTAAQDFVPLVYDKLPDKISHRFFPREFPSNAVFSVDVDTYFSCEALESALLAWQAHGEDAVVGFHPRALAPNGYDWWESFEPPFRRNTLFVTKGAITHKRVFGDFFRAEYADLRELVNDEITGEDLLMSFILATRPDAKLFTICLEESHHCNVSCQQNKVRTLFHRTSGARERLLRIFFGRFGEDSLRPQSGQAGIVWQSDDPKDRNYCRSNNDLIGSKPPCTFCNFNEVCPSDVGF